MKTHSVIALLGLLLLFQKLNAQIGPINCGMIDTVPAEGSSASQDCDNNFNNFRSNHADDMVPQGIDRTLKIKTNVVFVQDDNGKGNFSVSDPDHMDYWDRIFDSLNYKLQVLIQESCNCSTSPLHYSNIHLEFVPRYVEIQNSYYWNHRHDADSNTYNSSNKPYLNAIHNLATQTPGYVDGFDWIITTDSIFWNRWIDNNETIPIWNLGYDCITGPVYTVDSSCVNYSGLPVDDPLDRPAMWHTPDKYLIDINAFHHVYPYGQDMWDILVGATAEGALHEYGHYFNLGHPSSDTVCPNNIMQPGGSSSRTSFSGCQVRTMYETLMTKNLRKYVICEDKLDFDLIIDSVKPGELNLEYLEIF